MSFSNRKPIKRRKPKPFRIVKTVQVAKIHECLACSQKIQVGQMAINENGFNEDNGYFNSYFHLIRECANEFMDIVGSTMEEREMIEQALQKYEEKKSVETLI